MKHLSGYLYIVVLSAFVVLSGGLLGCEPAPERTFSPPDIPHGNELPSRTTVLAVVPDVHKPTETDTALDSKPVYRVAFNERGRAAVYTARIGDFFHVVSKGRPGVATRGIDQLGMSPDGSRMAYSAMVNGVWGMIVDGAVEVESDSVGDPVFSPDSQHVSYSASKGDDYFIVLDGKAHGTSGPVLQGPVFSADSGKLAYVVQTDESGGLRLVVTDIDFSAQYKREGCGDILASAPGHTGLAAVCSKGDKKIVTAFDFDEPEKAVDGRKYDEISNLLHGSGGYAYVAKGGGRGFIVLGRREEALPEGLAEEPPVVRPEGKGVGLVMSDTDGKYLYEAFSSGDNKGRRYDNARWLAYSPNGESHAYAASRGGKWFIVTDGKEGPEFDMAVMPVFSPDGKRVVYRVRDDGRRFVVVADTHGKVLKRHPAYEMVFKPVFTPDGKSVAYGVKDGRKLIWKVEALD